MTQKELNKILDKHEILFEGYSSGGAFAYLTYKGLSGLNFSNRNLQRIVLVRSNLTNANFTNTKLNGANLSGTDLTNADFTDADITNVDFSKANLTNTKNLPTQEQLLNKYFEKTKEGYIVYKVFKLAYDLPIYWDIKEGSIIEENVDMDRREDCSYGINAATKEWLSWNNLKHKPIWKCLLPFDSKICVPYGTSGKIRCNKLKLLEII